MELLWQTVINTNTDSTLCESLYETEPSQPSLMPGLDEILINVGCLVSLASVNNFTTPTSNDKLFPPTDAHRTLYCIFKTPVFQSSFPKASTHPPTRIDATHHCFYEFPVKRSLQTNRPLHKTLRRLVLLVQLQNHPAPTAGTPTLRVFSSLSISFKNGAVGNS